ARVPKLHVGRLDQSCGHNTELVRPARVPAEGRTILDRSACRVSLLIQGKSKPAAEQHGERDALLCPDTALHLLQLLFSLLLQLNSSLDRAKCLNPVSCSPLSNPQLVAGIDKAWLELHRSIQRLDRPLISSLGKVRLPQAAPALGLTWIQSDCRLEAPD